MFVLNKGPSVPESDSNLANYYNLTAIKQHNKTILHMKLNVY